MAAEEASHGKHLCGPRNMEWRPVAAMEDILLRYCLKRGHSRMIMVHYLYPVVKRRICSKFVIKTKVFFSLLLSHRKITCFLLDYRAARLTVAIRKTFYFD